MAQVQNYDIGEYWQPEATFQAGGVDTDPTALQVKVMNPTGTITTLDYATPATLTPASTPVARTAVGKYKLIQEIDDAGYWEAYFKGTGAAATAEHHSAVGEPSPFFESGQIGTRALVGLAEMKDWLQRKQISAVDDLDLAAVINDISDRFQQEAEREIKPMVPNPFTRSFVVDARGPSEPWYVDGDYRGERAQYRRMVRIGDLTSFTQVQIIDDVDWTTVLETVPLTSITAHPTVRQAWEPIRKLELRSDVTGLARGMRVSVTGVWGFPSVPGTVRQAVKDAVAATFDRDVEHYSQDLGRVAQEEGGNVIVIGGGRQRLLSMPPSTLAEAWRLRDPWLA